MRKYMLHIVRAFALLSAIFIGVDRTGANQDEEKAVNIAKWFIKNEVFSSYKTYTSQNGSTEATNFEYNLDGCDLIIRFFFSRNVENNFTHKNLHVFHFDAGDLQGESLRYHGAQGGDSHGFVTLMCSQPNCMTYEWLSKGQMRTTKRDAFTLYISQQGGKISQRVVEGLHAYIAACGGEVDPF